MGGGRAFVHPSTGCWHRRSHGGAGLRWARARVRCLQALPRRLPDARDLAALWAPDEPVLPALLAQIAVKRLLWRLPGFVNATIGHARTAFLSMPAEFVAEDRTVEVRLGDAPVSIMLNLTGLSRQRYLLPDGRTLRLSQEGGR